MCVHIISADFLEYEGGIFKCFNSEEIEISSQGLAIQFASYSFQVRGVYKPQKIVKYQ